MDIAEELALLDQPTDPKISEIQEDIARAVKLYNEGDPIEALFFLIDAHEKIERFGDGVPRQTILEMQYYMYKADALSSNDRSRCIRPSINPLRLEMLVLQDKTGKRQRAVKYHERFGRLGLRVHDFLERRGR